MKRSSEGSQPFKARKRYNPEEEAESDDGDIGNGGLAAMRGVTGRPPAGISADALLHQSSMLASHHQLGDASIPSLLANLQQLQQQQLHHQQLHHQQQQFRFPPHNTQPPGADALTQYLLTSHLSRGTIYPQQLQWLGLATNTASTTQQQQPDYMDRINYFANRTALGLANPESLMAYNLNPFMLGSQMPQYPSSIGLPSDHGITGPPPPPQPPSAVDAISNTETVTLSLSSDRSNLSEYQCLIREQIDLFAASQVEIDGSAQGRNRPIVVDQVGIQCRHCASLPSSRRSRGAVYFPAKLNGLYQAAQVCLFPRLRHLSPWLSFLTLLHTQNMTLNHFTTACQNMPQDVREEMLRLKQRKSYVLGGGK
jgi:hypothetical protein